MRNALTALVAAMVGLTLGCFAAPDPEPPGAKKDAGAPWPAEQAARITYDRDNECFILSNVSPHAIRYEGERYTSGTIGAYSITERQLPTGEWIDVTPAIKCKGEFWGFHPLAPGKQVELGGVRQDGRRLDEHFAKIAEKPEVLPARVGIRVQTDAKEPDGSKSEKVVYSEPIILPRILNAER